MAKILTISERRKKNQRLVVVISAIIFLTAIVLFMGLGKEPEVRNISGFLDNEVTRQVAEVIIRDVFIPESFFNDELLADFKEYIPISAPASWGRDDPFSSF